MEGVGSDNTNRMIHAGVRPRFTPILFDISVFVVDLVGYYFDDS